LAHRPEAPRSRPPEHPNTGFASSSCFASRASAAVSSVDTLGWAPRNRGTRAKKCDELASPQSIELHSTSASQDSEVEHRTSGRPTDCGNSGGDEDAAKLRMRPNRERRQQGWVGPILRGIKDVFIYSATGKMPGPTVVASAIWGRNAYPAGRCAAASGTSP
jgi:hypothetical protein